MSKSRGNFLDPDDAVRTLGSDGARFVTLREVPFDRDAEVSWDSVIRRYNADLANNFGNLASRVLNMAVSYCGGCVPETRADGPLVAAARAVAAGEVDVVLLTTAMQVVHLLQVAEEAGIADDVVRGLGTTVLASIGPTTSEALRERALEPDLEASHPKMGFLVREAADQSRAVLHRKRPTGM